MNLDINKMLLMVPFALASLRNSFGFTTLLLGGWLGLPACQVPPEPAAKAEISFSFQSGRGTNPGGRITRIEAEEYGELRLRLNNLSTAETEDLTLGLTRFGEEWVTQPIERIPGEYQLVAFEVTDTSRQEILLATPTASAEMAYLVNTPLPLTFQATHDEFTLVTPEVLRTEGFSPAEFGYPYFGWQPVEIFRLLLTVVEPDSTGTWTWAEGARVRLRGAEEGGDYSGMQETTTLEIPLRQDGGAYRLIARKSGFVTHRQWYTVTELQAYTETPLMVYLTPRN